MYIKIIVAAITFFGIIFWWISRQNTHAPSKESQSANPTGDQDEKKDQLEDDQAAEVVATWNLLHPPS